MEETPGSLAVSWGGATFSLDSAAHCASNAEMRIPESDFSGLFSGNVDFNLMIVCVRSRLTR